MKKTVDISTIKLNKKNPRKISDKAISKLAESIKNFPEMLNVRPIVVDKNMVVIGGNQRLEACRRAGLKEVPVYIAEELTKAQADEFLIKDNITMGDWDWDVLANEWDIEELSVLSIDGSLFAPRVEPQKEERQVTKANVIKTDEESGPKMANNEIKYVKCPCCDKDIRFTI